MKKALFILASIIVTLVLVSIVYIKRSGPDLPPGAEDIITKVIESGPGELRGKQGYVHNGDVRIWYESISPPDSTRGTILLVMGIGNDALAWPGYFMESLLEVGYRLVRMDNRGTGLSGWVENWNRETAYTLEDMAKDGIAVLDTLGIEKAHMLGVSLGGMIAQTMAIGHPDRALSLISIMSSGYIMDPELPSINTGIIRKLVTAYAKYGLSKREMNQIKFQVLARQLLQGSEDHEMDVEDMARSVLYNLRNRRGYNPQASRQQSEATIKSGSRYESLKSLTIPTLIVHGTGDPLINISHGKKCCEIIPGADCYWVQGMGHDIPPVFLEEISGVILSHLEKHSES